MHEIVETQALSFILLANSFNAFKKYFVNTK